MSTVKRILDIENDAHAEPAQESVNKKGHRVFTWECYEEERTEDDFGNESGTDLAHLVKALREEFGTKRVKVDKKMWPAKVTLTLEC